MFVYCFPSQTLFLKTDSRVWMRQLFIKRSTSLIWFKCNVVFNCCIFWQGLIGSVNISLVRHKIVFSAQELFTYLTFEPLLLVSYSMSFQCKAGRQNLWAVGTFKGLSKTVVSPFYLCTKLPLLLLSLIFSINLNSSNYPLTLWHHKLRRWSFLRNLLVPLMCWFLVPEDEFLPFSLSTNFCFLLGRWVDVITALGFLPHLA